MCRRERIGYGLLLSAIAGFLLTAAVALAASNIKEKGMLEAVEQQGKVVVITRADYKGAYQVSPWAIILNGQGRKTTLDTFLVPMPVEYDVEYTATGPIIKRIREIPQ